MHCPPPVIIVDNLPFSKMTGNSEQTIHVESKGSEHE